MSLQLQLFRPLEDFEARLPYNAHCSPTKRFGDAVVIPKQQSRAFPYIQINTSRIDYLCFDCDYDASGIRHLELDIPGPTLTAITRDSGYAHLLYELLYPIPKKHSKTTGKLLKDVIFAYREMLCADKCITTQNQLVKNPLSSEWDVLTGYKPFSLSELSESVRDEIKAMGKALRAEKVFERTDEPVTVRPFEETIIGYSRNCSLFNNVRFFAYSVVGDHGSYETLYEAVYEKLEELNDSEIPKHFADKLDRGELVSIARSVAWWTYRNRGRFVSRGAMGLPTMKGTKWEPDEYRAEVTRRRRLSAEWTHSLRKERVKRRLQRGVCVCIYRGFELKPENIATLGGVSLATVYNYKGFVDEYAEKVRQNLN